MKPVVILHIISSPLSDMPKVAFVCCMFTFTLTVVDYCLDYFSNDAAVYYRYCFIKGLVIPVNPVCDMLVMCKS